ncbi:cytochrome P450 9e2-like [Cylas formicarius]|uniref:cytochrome P450 9e2-like n=1 Tax=Cylas formicarius TaxID=197179 RepID=UPI00295892E3|nr:cytochrome P450 9e2-like [Cylas formicarius]XP_060525752.1 cytochrome P450 9e2-like [Cylas formicarius]XP_060525753.1 cytochrome P450 9e2-like [Cylas formicarius]XP_060525754.1 cytochrome P450 9e2-like [Cylas formicarius]XP_060525755.1 cytochrome P450 9e2-like [Cylas formicarius]
MFWLIISVLAVVTLWFLLDRPLHHWEKLGAKQTKPWIILGDSWPTVLGLSNFPDMLQTVYNLYPEARYTGMYQCYTPALLLKDPELIKLITVKDFDHFTDRSTFLDPEVDPVVGRNLLSLKGQRWRDMRATLSGSFTSSKMKFIFGLINATTQRFVEHLKNRQGDVIELELKDALTRFANDVIATSAFGLTVDSLSQPENEFYLSGKKMSDLTSLRVLVKFFGYLVFPQLFRTLKIGLLDSSATRFLQKVLTETIRVREEEGIVRPDMINILLEAKKGAKDEEPVLVDTGFATVEESSPGRSKSHPAITNDDITSQAFIFFFAGFNSSSTAMCFAAYELARHPEVQCRLRDEIHQVQRHCEGKITYEALLGMKYLDMVVSEVLRKWPPIFAMDRVCTKPYVIEAVKSDEEPLRLRVGDAVILPFQAIHRDPINYPDPDKFDPERFSDENKRKIRPYTYLPFGVGPRNCLGSRFALLEVKMLLFNLLAAFELVPTARSVIPLRLAKRSPNVVIEGGLWFGLKRL